MTIDLWIRDAAGLPIALIAHNPPIAQRPAGNWDTNQRAA